MKEGLTTLGQLTPGTRFITNGTGRTGKLLRIGIGSATVEVDRMVERSFTPAVGPNAGEKVTIRGHREVTQWSLGTEVFVDERPEEEVRVVMSGRKRLSDAERRIPKALRKARAATTLSKGEHKMGQFNQRVNSVIDALQLKSVPEVAERMGVSKVQLYQALKEDREGAEVSSQEVLDALEALEGTIGLDGTAAPEEPTEDQDEETPVVRAVPKPSQVKAKNSAKAKAAKAEKAQPAAAKAKAEKAPKAPKEDKPREPAIFWHNIGAAEDEWLALLVERGEIPANFDNAPGDKGEALLKQYVDGDVVIAYAPKYGAVGVAKVKAGDYALLGKKDEGFREDGLLCHRLGVEWVSVAPALEKGLPAPEVREKFGIYHPIATNAKIKDQDAAAKLVKALEKRFK